MQSAFLNGSSRSLRARLEIVCLQRATETSLLYRCVELALEIAMPSVAILVYNISRG
uniref:Uncharacterized protein n=1 Tax=Myoviridae sp. ctp4Q36 TaxID=2827708 RepID=A0A8S5T1L2_9CAUD|nr:MAG TPA: hypothetical protein [Myoviridae sp. ctp4Q36]